MTLLEKVKQNLIVTHNEDDTLLEGVIAAAISYAEGYQHLGADFYAENTMSPATEQGVIMLASHFYESRDGSTGGFFNDNVSASEQVWKTVHLLLRMGKEWQV
jgi:uncharacterized phage protein (predicted DNA packaging)